MSSRREFLRYAAAVGCAAPVIAGCTRTGGAPVIHGTLEDTGGLTPDQALAKLVEGNARFVSMTDADPNRGTERLMAVSRGQQPFVGVLGCVDSRVPPELIFDRGLGDIFDARVAGAIPDDAAIGSLEFGVEEFDVPLLVVLGHSRCGAVTAAVKSLDAGAKPAPGMVGAVVAPIIPAVKAVAARGKTGVELINGAAREVVAGGVQKLSASPVLAPRLAAGKLKAVGAFYDLDSGKVEILR